MARTSKNTSKKTEVKEVKQEVKTEIVEEKKIDEPKMDATDIIQNECDVNIDDMDDNLTENGIQKDENNDEVTKSVNHSDEVTNDGDKTSIEEDNKPLNNIIVLQDGQKTYTATIGWVNAMMNNNFRNLSV